ncbi:hypothetical protein BASA60_009837, partial [Batrachochytrium salamandrivorans]
MYWNCRCMVQSISRASGATPRTTTKLAQLQGTFFEHLFGSRPSNCRRQRTYTATTSRWPSINICGPFHDAQVGLGLERAGADTPFRAGLANEVKDMLLHHEPPNSLDKLILLATRIDARLLEHRQDRQLGRQTGTHTAT